MVSYSLFKKPLLLTSTKTRKDRVSLTDLINNLQPNDVLFKGIWDPEKMDEIEKHEEKAHQKFYNGILIFFVFDLFSEKGFRVFSVKISRLNEREIFS